MLVHVTADFLLKVVLMEANSEKVERAIAEVAIQEKEEGEYMLENKKEGLGEQCHLVKEEFVKLRGIIYKMVC